MATIKEIKKELDGLGIEYKKTATKSQLEWLLDHLPKEEEKVTTDPNAELVAEAGKILDNAEVPTADRLCYDPETGPFHGFRDPNATPGTQAE